MVKPGTPEQTKPNPHVSAATLILQWLSYAFWGWLGVSLIWLAAVTFAHFIAPDTSSSTTSEAIAYPLASTVVLAIIASVCDFFYTRKESVPKKIGMENVIMIIHAVIFALLSIGATVVAVFALVNLLISIGASSEESAKITLFTALVAALFYLALASRVALAGQVKRMRGAAWSVMMVTVIGIFVASIVGPTSYSIYTKQDRLIESSLSPITESISVYVNKNDKLPENLNELSIKNEDAKKVIAENLITYKPNTKPAGLIEQGYQIAPEQLELGMGAAASSIMPAIDQKQFYYQLCVDYRAEKKNEWDSVIYPQEDDGYASYISGYDSHGKGNHCYKVSTPGYGKY